jgi:hypothetical protein
MNKFFLYTGLIFIAKLSCAQNLENFGKEKALKLGGGFSLNQIYSRSDVRSGRAPYSYVASGNLNLSMYGWSIPVGFSFSNEQFTYQQPFNRYSIHPTYKWFTAHLGYTSVNFSPYTVNGHLFLGAAADVKKEKWFVTSFYGRLLKRSAPDSVHNNPGSFERWGYGTKGGYIGDKTSVSLSLFKAEDEIDEFLQQQLEANGVSPQQNIAVGVEMSQKIVEKFLLKIDWGSTVITNNLLSPLDHSDSLSHIDILNPTSSTAYYQAVKSTFAYQGNNFSIGTNYERIDPGYRTLGAYYFNNDLENISLIASTQLFNNRLNIAANSGVQHDNLDKKKASSLKRWVGSVNLNIIPFEKISVQAAYSNFSTFTNIRSQFLSINQTTPYSNLDTLTFTQLSQTINISATYNISTSPDKVQNVMLSGNMQQASNRQGEHTVANSGSTFYNSFATYMMSLLQQQISLSLSINYSKVASVYDTDIFGPVMSVNKMLLNKKVRLNASAAANRTTTKLGAETNILTTRISSSYQAGKGHQFQLTSSVMRKTSHTQDDKVLYGNDFTIMVGYNYQFQ